MIRTIEGLTEKESRELWFIIAIKSFKTSDEEIRRKHVEGVISEVRGREDYEFIMSLSTGGRERKMIENPEFKKAMNEMLGEDVAKLLKCQECGSELIHCPHCQEVLCPNECEGKKEDG